MWSHDYVVTIPAGLREWGHNGKMLRYHALESSASFPNRKSAAVYQAKLAMSGLASTLKAPEEDK